MDGDSEMKVIFTCSVNDKGIVQNDFSLKTIVEADKNGQEMQIDTYFAFLIKTLIDDFGGILVNITKGAINKEQYEAAFMDNLNIFITENTLVKEKLE